MYKAIASFVQVSANFAANDALPRNELPELQQYRFALLSNHKCVHT